MGYVLSGLSFAHMIAGRFEEALSFAKKSVIEAPSWTSGHTVQIQCLVHLGRIDEARSAAQRLLKIAPQLTVSEWRSRYAIRDPERIERACGALRIAGIPE
jgi:adenylate cyclase